MRMVPAGGYVFIKCALDNDLIRMVEKTPYFVTWRDKLSWKYSFEDEVSSLSDKCSIACMVCMQTSTCILRQTDLVAHLLIEIRCNCIAVSCTMQLKADMATAHIVVTPVV